MLLVTGLSGTVKLDSYSCHYSMNNSEMKKRKIDWKLVDKMRDNTYSLRRKEIVKDEPLVAQVQERCPALFFVPQNSTHTKRTILLLGLSHFLRDDALAKTVEATEDEGVFCKGMKVGPVMVKDGEEIVDVSVVLEEAVVLTDLKDIPSAVAMLMGLLYCLNIDYPKNQKYAFEVIQKVFMNIGGGQCSSLVHGLRNRLLRKTM
ncbi:uncharacterized protein LOC124877366 isoform X4 [Girardinichthys multiradiatus]|uniref:uncharacterized protein LOC124877366 isoform X4 n=1 Tax=Girardinichthys multiradiatus TaxID=208333 RepID=UPI001FAB9200|nr:uncharacterized protein LOC124877366 isoform X4 [Girardinichthys multiradiatus]